MSYLLTALTALITLSFCSLLPLVLAAVNPETVEQVVDVAPVWSGHPVGFSLLTHKDRQFVAFYDTERRATVGVRKIDAKEWQFAHVPETIGWDSHNYLAMSVDDDGYLHLSGNMHATPLVYFRTTRPLDITSFERVKSLTGGDEARVTYPAFSRGPAGELIFTYRTGYSGNGNQIYTVYDHKTRTWSRLLDKPLFDGEGKRNAYPAGPVKGPDGWYHLVWVWREAPSAADTNHDPSYARSRDLRRWETSDGKPLTLPITLATSDIIDPVPIKGGTINGSIRIGFDSQKRVVISYLKYDENGKSQVYNARRENSQWKHYQTSDWDYRWNFGGAGSIPFEIRTSSVRSGPNRTLIQTYQHKKYGDGGWTLDEKNLKPIGTLPPPDTYPETLRAPQSTFPEMQVLWAGDSGISGEPGARYVLRWETLGSNRDRPQTGPLPPPSLLRLYKLKAPVVAP